VQILRPPAEQESGSTKWVDISSLEFGSLGVAQLPKLDHVHKSIVTPSATARSGPKAGLDAISRDVRSLTEAGLVCEMASAWRARGSRAWRLDATLAASRLISAAALRTIAEGRLRVDAPLQV
jgi:hypothetical protein